MHGCTSTLWFIVAYNEIQCTVVQVLCGLLWLIMRFNAWLYKYSVFIVAYNEIQCMAVQVLCVYCGL